jgi:hypothetical protein
MSILNPRITLLGLLLSAGLSVAAEPRAVASEAATCEEQCKALDEACSNPCKDIRGGARAACSAQCKQLGNACKGSCREKGEIDAQYMLERIKPPKAPSGGPRGEDEDAS